MLPCQLSHSAKMYVRLYLQQPVLNVKISGQLALFMTCSKFMKCFEMLKNQCFFVQLLWENVNKLASCTKILSMRTFMHNRKLISHGLIPAHLDY